MEAYAVRSELGSAWPFAARLVETGSGRRARPASFRIRNPRFTEPSGFMDPRWDWDSVGGLCRSESGEPIELFATSMPDA